MPATLEYVKVVICPSFVTEGQIDVFLIANFVMSPELNFLSLQRDNFSSLLDRLLTSLKLDLQQYRVMHIIVIIPYSV